MKTLEEKLEKYIVVKFLNQEEESYAITLRDSFESQNLCDCFGNYGQKIGCYDAGCYSFDNSGCDIVENFYESLSEKFPVGSIMDDEGLSKEDLVTLLSEKDDSGIFPDFDKMVMFFQNWKSENEHHTDIKAWTYHDGSNFQTCVLENYYGPCDVEEIDEEEERKILDEFTGAVYVNSGTSESEETENYIFTTTRWSDDPWLASVVIK